MFKHTLPNRTPFLPAVTEKIIKAQLREEGGSNSHREKTKSKGVRNATTAIVGKLTFLDRKGKEVCN